MGALFSAYHSIGYYLFQSGFYCLSGPSGYLGRMDLCIYFLVPADLHRCCLSESFLAFSEVLAEEVLFELYITTLCGNDNCIGNTDGSRIYVLFVLVTPL